MVVYKITNLVSGKIYVGQTKKTANKRFREHVRAAIRNQDDHGGSVPLCKAIRKYGENAFTVEVLETVSSETELHNKEKEWIARLNATNSNIGYNIQTGGVSGTKPENTRHKIALKKKENWEDGELSARMKAGLKKATKTWQERCERNRKDFTCPICGKTLRLMPCEMQSRKFCSRSCATVASNKKRVGYHKIEPLGYDRIRKAVDEWCRCNASIIEATPLNKIATNLSQIMNIANQHNVYDWRTLSYIVSKTYSRKEMLVSLKRKYMLDQSE